MTTVCVAGVGAVGATIAARLAASGVTVQLFARGARLEQLRRDGLRVQLAEELIEARPPVNDRPDFGVQDLVFLAAKAHALPDLLASLEGIIGAHTLVVPLVNGIPWWYFQHSGGPFEGQRVKAVDPRGTLPVTSARAMADTLPVGGFPMAGSLPMPGSHPMAGGLPIGGDIPMASALPAAGGPPVAGAHPMAGALPPGSDTWGDGGPKSDVVPPHLVGCVVYVTAHLQPSGLVTVMGTQRFIVGELAGGISARTMALAGLLTRAGLQGSASKRIRDDVWTKVALNLATNPLSVITETTLREQFTDPKLVPIVEAVIEETARVAHGYQAQFSLSTEEMLATGRRAGPFETSMLQDYRAGRRLELDAIAGSVLELAGKIGLQMPITRVIVDLCAHRAASRMTLAQ